MIRIVRGPRSRMAGPTGLAIEIDRGFPVPWRGVRALLASLRARLGDNSVERAIAPERAVLGLVLRRLEPMLTDDERRRRAAVAARPLGFMSHNGMTSAPIREAWARVLRPLCAGLEIVVPDTAAIDPETLVVFRHLMRGEHRPTFVFGFDEHARIDHPLWARDHDMVAGQLASLELLDGTVVEQARDPDDAKPVVLRDPLDDGAELAAAEAVAGALDAHACEQVLATMRDAFACFGFSAVLRLGLDLLAREPALAPAQLAELHTLVALAAYNRQVETGDNVQLADLLDHHFSEALAHERDPACRGHLLYRLCINRGRRKGSLDEACELATRAIDEARRADDPVIAAYVEAWARNGRAYVHARLRRVGDAIADCERAHELLAGAHVTDAVPASELEPSRVVILDNLARLGELAKDLPRAAHWQQELEAAEAAIPEALVLSPNRWASLLRAQGDLRAAIRAAERGLAAARTYLNPFSEDRYAADLGDLYYRLGDARAAFDHYTAVLAIRRRVRDASAAGLLLQAELSRAVAAARAGLYADADAGLVAALADPQCASPAARAELLAARALVAARASDGDTAEAHLGEAIEIALELGVRDTLLRVARTGAEMCSVLGHADQARDAFERALDIAGADETPAPAAELFAVYLGLAETTGNVTWYARALEVGAGALDDPDTWWDLPRLFAGLVPLARAGSLEPRELASARDLAAIAVQRPDCAHAADELRAI